MHFYCCVFCSSSTNKKTSSEQHNQQAQRKWRGKVLEILRHQTDKQTEVLLHNWTPHNIWKHIWTAMCSYLNHEMPLIKMYCDTISVLYITSLTFFHPLWWTSRSHALTYTPDSTDGWQARNACHTNTPTTDPPAVRLGWKTACSECQTGREHAEFEGTRVEISWKGCVSASKEDREGDGRTDVQHK